jgi:PleD family two-component response regulator
MLEEQYSASILIVDDTPVNLHLLSRMLVREGYHVRAALDGIQALESIYANPPDLILLDIMMPEMDGYETCIHLKQDEQTSDIPIIFISALDETINKVKAFSIGGVDYIAKPFQHEEVLARVQTHLALRTLRLNLEEKNRELEARNAALQEALDTIQTLSGLIPICAWCGRKIRDDDQWISVEDYIETNTEAQFTHSICPECMHKVTAET